MAHTIYPGLFMRRNEDDLCFYSQKDNIIQLHSMFNHDFLGCKTAIEVIDSHRAYPYYDKKRDTIVFDTHFFDILVAVTAIMISGKDVAMDTLADACTADYFLCKDEIYVALDYAILFDQEKATLEKLINGTADRTRKLVNRQILFVLEHEQGHALLAYNRNDERFQPFRYFFDKEFERIFTASKIIQSIDLSQIKDDLDKINRGILEEPFDYSAESIFEVFTYNLQLFKIVQKGIELLNVSESDIISREEAIYYACDRYLKRGGIKTLNRSQYEDDSIVDGFALQSLLNYKTQGEDILTQMKASAFAYFSCLLTMDIITCVNACVMNIRSEAYKGEDLVWNRLRLEREIFNNTMRQYAFRNPYGYAIANEVFCYSHMLVNAYNKLYARFCDRMYAVKHPSKNTPYCSYGSAEYEVLYNRLHTMLTMRLKN